MDEMNKEIRVSLPQIGQEARVPLGTTAWDIYRQEKWPSVTRPMCVEINNSTSGLQEELYKDCTLVFVDYSEDSGLRTYVRTLATIVGKAVQELRFDGRDDVTIEHAISNGYYCRWGKKPARPTEDEVEQLRQKVQEIISADLPIEMEQMKLEDAVALFKQIGRTTTSELIEQHGKCYNRVVRIGDYVDFIFETVLPRTGMLWGFGLEPYQEGILIRIPDPKTPDKLRPAPVQKKLFEAYKELLNLLHVLGLEDVAPINRHVHAGNDSDLITISEAMQEKQIAKIAVDIARRHSEGVRIVLIAGPSSSGKTTFSKRLKTQLMINLLKPYTLSLDDFFLDRENTPKDEHGAYDYESLYAVDLPYFHSTLQQMIKGLEIDLPTYDFISGTRRFRDNKLRLELDHILIIEGIHALNPELVASIQEQAIYRIYVSALTTISLDPHNWISTSDNRLLRRIVRDAKYRGVSASETIQRWKAVRRGEEKWIFPFQENADVMFNSAMLYELAALRTQAEPLLSQVKQIDPSYPQAKRLLHFLKMFEPVDFEYAPPTSILREFLGGSSFKY